MSLIENAQKANRTASTLSAGLSLAELLYNGLSKREPIGPARQVSPALVDFGTTALANQLNADNTRAAASAMYNARGTQSPGLDVGILAQKYAQDMKAAQVVEEQRNKEAMLNAAAVNRANELNASLGAERDKMEAASAGQFRLAKSAAVSRSMDALTQSILGGTQNNIAIEAMQDRQLKDQAMDIWNSGKVNKSYTEILSDLQNGVDPQVSATPRQPPNGYLGTLFNPANYLNIFGGQKKNGDEVTIPRSGPPFRPIGTDGFGDVLIGRSGFPSSYYGMDNTTFRTIAKFAAEEAGVPVEDILNFSKVESGMGLKYRSEQGYAASERSSVGGSASGPFQITDGTWRSLIGKYGKQYGYDATTDRYNPLANARMAAALYKDSLNALPSSKGITDWRRTYAAHHFGPYEAGKLIKAFDADPNTAVSDIFSKATLNSNPYILKAGTAGGLLANWEDRLNSYDLNEDKSEETATTRRKAQEEKDRLAKKAAEKTATQRK